MLMILNEHKIILKLCQLLPLLLKITIEIKCKRMKPEKQMKLKNLTVSHEQKEGGGQMLRQKSKAKSNCKQKSSCAGKKSQREVF